MRQSPLCRFRYFLAALRLDFFDDFLEEDDFLELLPDDLREAFRDAAIRCLLFEVCAMVGTAVALH